MRGQVLPGMLLAVVATAAGPLAFDVASVKPTAHGRNAEGSSHTSLSNPNPGRFLAVNASIYDCIGWAYELKPFQISGPAWLRFDEESFDIDAKAPPETTPAQVRVMVQNLLADRFLLATHRETRILPVYELTIGGKGLRLTALKGDLENAGFHSQGGLQSVRVESERATIARLADRLSRDLDRPVIDRTGLTEQYKIALEWFREGDGPSIFSSIQEQLGLRLEAAKAPIEVLVVDHAEKIPTAN